MSGARRSARILEISLATLWIIVIGLNCAGSCTSVALGSRTMSAPLSLWKALQSPNKMALIASMTCCLIIDHEDL